MIFNWNNLKQISHTYLTLNNDVFNTYNDALWLLINNHNAHTNIGYK